MKMMKNIPKNTVINLTEAVLKTAEIQILSLGLTYCPVNFFAYNQTRIDIFKFIRKIKLMKYFQLNKYSPVPSNFSSGINVPDTNLQVRDVPLLQTLQNLSDADSTNFESTQEAIINLGINTNQAAISPFRPSSTILPLMPRDAVDIFKEGLWTNSNASTILCIQVNIVGILKMPNTTV